MDDSVRFPLDFFNRFITSGKECDDFTTKGGNIVRFKKCVWHDEYDDADRIVIDVEINPGD